MCIRDSPFTDAMIRRGKHYEIVELKARQGQGQYAKAGRGKEGRIAGLVSYYRQGVVFHNSVNSGPLEQQLLSFPRSKRWDLMDAAAYIVEMLDIGNKFFYPSSSEEESQSTVEQEYDILDNEESRHIEPELIYNEPSYANMW